MPRLQAAGVFGIILVVGVLSLTAGGFGCADASKIPGLKEATICTPGSTQQCDCYRGSIGIVKGVQACSSSGREWFDCYCGQGGEGEGWVEGEPEEGEPSEGDLEGHIEPPDLGPQQDLGHQEELDAGADLESDIAPDDAGSEDLADVANDGGYIVDIGSDPDTADAEIPSCMPTGASETICNGVDDDCDGQTDEDYIGTALSCGTGACQVTGITTCTHGVVTTFCAETKPDVTIDDACNGVDDDCDGQTDEDYTVVETACGEGICFNTGFLTCVDGMEQNSCQPYEPSTIIDDACNGVDDDCDGQTDEDYQPRPVDCGIGACYSTGFVTCMDGVEKNTCEPGQPMEEVCNGVDDDCDGQTDEYAEVGPSCGNGRHCVRGACQLQNNTGTYLFGIQLSGVGGRIVAWSDTNVRLWETPAHPGDNWSDDCQTPECRNLWPSLSCLVLEGFQGEANCITEKDRFPIRAIDRNWGNGLVGCCFEWGPI